MATTTETVPIPSPSLHMDPQNTSDSRGPVSEVGTLDRVDSPGAESLISQPTGPFPPPPQRPAQLHPSNTGSYSFPRQRSNSNLSPPRPQGEWAPNASADEVERKRSNSATRYYTQARERSGTVSSVNDQTGFAPQDSTRNYSSSPPQAPHGFHSPSVSQHYPSPSAAMNPPQSPPSGPAPAYSSPPAQYASTYQSPPPAHPSQSYPQPDAHHPSASQAQNPADLGMVTALESLGTEAALVDCPRCETSTRTTTTKEAGDAVTLWAAVLCCLTGALCAWVPCVMDSCKDTVHRCSQCQLLLATVTSNGTVKVAQGINKPAMSQYNRQAPMQEQWKPQEQWGQHRDAGPAPGYWDSQPPQQWQKTEDQAPQRGIGEQSASVPLAEMEGTAREPVELPAMGESSKDGAREQERLEEREQEKEEKSEAKTEKVEEAKAEKAEEAKAEKTEEAKAEKAEEAR